MPAIDSSVIAVLNAAMARGSMTGSSGPNSVSAASGGAESWSAVAPPGAAPTTSGTQHPLAAAALPQAAAGAQTLGRAQLPSQSVSIVGARSGDEALLGTVLQALATTTTGRSVLQRIQAGRPLKVQFQEPTEMQARSPGALAVYGHELDTVFILRSTASKDPEQAAIEFAHEATHWLHDDLLDAADFARITDPAQRAQVSLATETEAFMVMARVAKEMGGFKLLPGTPGVRADGSLATHQQTWQQLAATREYNPRGLQLPASWYQRVLTDH